MTKIAKDYLMKFPYPADNKTYITESELIGGLCGFIEFSDNDITTCPEYVFEIDNQKIHVDLLVERKEHQVILEIKKTRKNIIKSNAAIDQIFTYLENTNINHGILLFVPDKPTKFTESEIVERKIGNKKFEVIKIFPKS